MPEESLKEILIQNMEFVQKKNGLDFSNEVADAQADSQFLGVLKRAALKAGVEPYELLDPAFRFSYNISSPPWCS